MTPEEMAARIKRRVARMTTDDLMSWADTAASGMQRYLDDFRRSPDESYLAEIHLAAASMDAVASELGIRLKQAKDLDRARDA